MRLLLTRPAKEAQASAARLRALGHTVVLSPVTRIAPLLRRLPPGEWAAIAVTSAHAAQFLEKPLPAALAAAPVFAVGGKSAQAARQAGFLRVQAGQGGERELAALIRSALPAGARLLYLAGRERMGGLAALLQDAGLVCVSVETYGAPAAAALPPLAAAALAMGRIDAVLHYSARAARIFSDLAADAGLGGAAARPRHLCLSGDIAAALAVPGAARVDIAAAPHEPALFALLGAGREVLPGA